MEHLRTVCADKGVFLRSEALAAGYDDKSLARLRRTGELHRVSHGAYTYGDIWAAADARARHRLLARAAYRAARSDVAISHSSGILEHTDKFWGLDLERPHLTRLDGHSGRRGRGVRPHRGKLVDGDVVRVDGFRTMAPARACIELTTVAGVESSLVSINAILSTALCTITDLWARYKTMDHWPSTLTTDLILRLADGRNASVGESRTFYLLWKHGFPAPIPQYKVYDGRGQVVAVVDFAWPELGIFLEFDGKAKYQKLLKPGEDPSDVVFREKRREDLVRRITGWRCLRMVWVDLESPDRTVAWLRREFAASAAA